MAVQQQTVIIAALALLVVYWFATPRSGSWTKRPHDLRGGHGFDALEDDEPILVSLIRFPFRVFRLPLTVSAWLFELCASSTVWIGTALTRAAGLTLVLLGFLFSLTVVGLCVGVPLIFIGSFILFLVT